MVYWDFWDEYNDRAYGEDTSKKEIKMSTIEISHINPATLTSHINDFNTPQSKAIDAKRSTLFNAIKAYGLACEKFGEGRAAREWRKIKNAILELEIEVEDKTEELLKINPENFTDIKEMEDF